MSDLNLLYTDVEEDLRTTVRALVAERCGPGGVIAMADGDRGLVGPLWKSLTTELGLAGLLVAEDRGGAGASAREAAVVLEELGRAIAPVPFLTSAVMATEVLRESESPLLSQLAEGTVTAALVVPFSVAPQAALPALSVVDGAVTGKVTSVAGALEADVLLVPVRAEDGIDLYAIESDHADVVSVVSLDMTRQLADVSFDAAAAVLVLHDAEGEVRRAVGTAAGLLASEQLGVARAALETTVAYLKDRRQFGRVVGGFQALKHRLADLYTGVESAAAAARHAAATLAEGDPDQEIAVSVAQAFCSDLAVLAGEEMVQLHGGIGMTWEHPAHLYLKRAKADQIALGTAGAHRARLAELVGLPA
jgi:alkylation response protein AidB-like acyl-CoA dehydrogenase